MLVSSSRRAGGVAAHPRRQDERLQGTGRDDRARQLLDGPHQAIAGAQRAADALPQRQEPGQLDRRDGLDLGPQRGERAAAEGPQHLGVAVVEAVDAASVLGREQLALDEPPGRHQPAEGVERHRRADAPPLRDGGDGRTGRACGRSGRRGPRAGRAPGRGTPAARRAAARHPSASRRPPGVLDGSPALLAGHPDSDDAPGALEVDEPVADVVAGDRLRAAALDVGERERPEGPEQVGDVLGVAAGPLGGQPLQLGLGARDLGRVEQVAQRQALAAAEQLGQQGRVERERGRALLGQRRVALVEELGDVAEHQRPGERRGLGALDVDHRHLARVEAPHEVGESGHVEDVLDALAHRLQHDRERGVLAGHLEQLGRPLPLLPQRLAPVGAAAGSRRAREAHSRNLAREQGRTRRSLR